MNIDYIVASTYFHPCGSQKWDMFSNKNAGTFYILGSQYNYQEIC